MKLATVDMDVMSELASEIVERQWHKENWNISGVDHSFTDENGDTRYIEEVQDEFNSVLDIIDDILNPEVY